MGGTRVAAVVFASFLAVSIGGCCGGGTTVEKTVEKTPIHVEQKTTGEQLMDLQKAYESGAITEQQYNKMKQEIIEKSGGK
jgi:hypothetical protein